MSQVVSSVSAFVLFVTGIYATSYAESAGCFNTQEGIDTYNLYYALVWIGFITLQIIANLIIVAFHPFGPFGDLFSDLHDFFIDQVIPRLRGRKIAKRHEGVLNNTSVYAGYRNRTRRTDFLLRHIRACERSALQGGQFLTEQVEGFDWSCTESFVRCIRAYMRSVLQDEHFLAERVDGFNGAGAAIEQKPGK
jgi:hypothetical protein